MRFIRETFKRGSERRLYDSVGATVYRTDLHGTVLITATLEGAYQVTTERGRPEQVEARAPPAAPAPQPSPSPTPGAACIDINTASREALQDIIHIDEERSGQMLELRPFSSVDDMVRIRGIAEGRLRAIKEQGLACVQ